MIEWLFTFLALYLLYKLIFDFIIPVSKVSSQMRSKMNQMNQQQYQHQRQKQQYQQKPFADQANKAANARPSADDYIDFEEIK
jgi:sortase (surface protein transpeptidase)